MVSLVACQWLSVNQGWCDQWLNVNNSRVHGLHVSDMGSQWLCLIEWLQVNGCMSIVVCFHWLHVNG